MDFKITHFLSQLKTFDVATFLIGLSLLFVNSSSLLAAEQVSPSKRLFVNSSSLPTTEEVSQTSKTPIEISIIYAPEEEVYLVDAIAQFNRAYRKGYNPETGKPLAKEEYPIFVKGESGSSGTVADAIINAIIAPNHDNVAKPTIFSPSVSHWLMLVNYHTGRSIFNLDESPATALAPVVIAIWESRLEAIKAKNGDKPVGWEELLAVFNSPNGWLDYDKEIKRKTVYYGHTDPFVSSTALSTLISEFYASARYHGNNPKLRRLGLAKVENDKIQQGVRGIENLIRHYSARTTEFKEYIAKGPDYLDFVALEENDLIYINQGKTNYEPPEKLVALYPKEGTFMHEHPFAIPKAPWVNNEQREAAKIFTQFILSETIQRKVLEHGFRPANDNVTVGDPITPKYGVDPNQPEAILKVPSPEVIATIQESWQLVKKQTDVLLVIDTSGSMSSENKLEQAKKAAQVFLNKMPSQNRVGLISFNGNVELRMPLDYYEVNHDRLREEVAKLSSSGTTSLYDAILQAFEILKTADSDDLKRIHAVVVLSDGQDTSSKATKRSVVDLIKVRREGRSPVIVIPVAYGSDADIRTLNSIARNSATRLQSGDPTNIQKIFGIIGSYF
ncbi:MAG: extracellular solute-binding protein [Candidatus Parabeggiatoa sp.]|nr:extracellular solute-binding protein [Candidatus Parabeggiatoa sp.]